MRQPGRIAAQRSIIISNCDVCSGLMFNAQRYKHMSVAPSTIRFPCELKKVFERILHGLKYFHEHPHHFTLDLDPLDRIFEYRAIGSYSFPVINVELEYMFDTLGFLWQHHDSFPYLLYLLEKLVDGLSSFFFLFLFLFIQNNKLQTQIQLQTWTDKKT